MDIDYSSLSDVELSEMLKDYGVDVGPINMATRKAYERKLHKLKTGQSMAATTKYEPVANDEDDVDDEVQFKSLPKQSYQPPPSNVIHRTPEAPQTRQRRDPTDNYSPTIDSRPSLNSARKTTRSYDPMTDRPTTKLSNSSTTTDQAVSSGGGLSLWVKLSALAVAVVLLYLIYNNMESNAATNIPKIPGKMEV